MKDQARAVITGASSGIGVALARHFAKCGHDLVLVARRELRLRALAGELTDRHHINVDCLPLDLSRPDSAARLHARATEGDREVEVSFDEMLAEEQTKASPRKSREAMEE